MEFPLISLVIACSLSLVLSLAAVLWCALFASPSSYIKRANRVERTLSDSLAAFEQLESKWLSYKGEISAIHESIEGVLDSVERKRRRISGAESRLNAGQTDAEPKSRGQIVDHYRAKVYGVPGA